MLRRGASSRLPPPAAAAAHARHPAGSQSRHQSVSCHCKLRLAFSLTTPCVGAMATEPAKGFRVRTISYFIGTSASWEEQIVSAAAFLRQARTAFEAAGAVLPPSCKACCLCSQP